MNHPARWLTRDDLASSAATASGLLQLSPDASSAVPLTPHDVATTADALRAAGVGERDRVVVALAEPAGSLWASASAEVAAAAATAGPRGRMRLHHLLSSVRATTLVATPTGAMDFLARLHLEFLLDPLDLGLRQVIVTGEIASPHTLTHLAGEFDATVTEVLANPFSGAAMAWRSSQESDFAPALRKARLGKDEFADSGEIVVAGDDTVLRTGYVMRGSLHTVGDHLLIRGVWVSLARLDKAMSKIDGVAGWELTVSRQGTLDAAVLTIRFARQSLVGNPMWKSRIEQALHGLTPVKIAVEISPEVGESRTPGIVTDQRGQHLGRDRALLT
ncbi:hypothetical protein [Nonomuraea soli]|uniref:Phenylacetate-CoA ligase n=1 Tax=Nonomuraea soli TaxID=1032476 RepID=A0A7W0HMK6_9ACTN|nr:hypothetical protein [Nonomuraea soli]MBA2888832.1 phenylacetate-CoA ligase [Nonomuraea soli]